MASAGLHLGDAARMPYREGVFDLIAVSMALHEMAPVTRSAVIEEARRRSLRPGGNCWSSIIIPDRSAFRSD